MGLKGTSVLNHFCSQFFMVRELRDQDDSFSSGHTGDVLKAELPNGDFLDQLKCTTGTADVPPLHVSCFSPRCVSWEPPGAHLCAVSVYSRAGLKGQLWSVKDGSRYKCCPLLQASWWVHRISICLSTSIRRGPSCFWQVDKLFPRSRLTLFTPVPWGYFS